MTEPKDNPKAGPQEPTPERLARIRAKTRPHDPIRHLTTEKGMAAFLDAALQERDPHGIAMALAHVEQAWGRLVAEGKRPLPQPKKEETEEIDAGLLARIRAKTSPYQAADFIHTEEDMAYYLKAALEDGDPLVITAVLGNVERARKRPMGVTKP